MDLVLTKPVACALFRWPTLTFKNYSSQGKIIKESLVEKQTNKKTKQKQKTNEENIPHKSRMKRINANKGWTAP